VEIAEIISRLEDIFVSVGENSQNAMHFFALSTQLESKATDLDLMIKEFKLKNSHQLTSYFGWREN
ncbi:MAG: hypothetical protein LBC41_15290, partial [Clostridiales bacterium]|nr:hypothetical protein [Clostridiales bacterium]